MAFPIVFLLYAGRILPIVIRVGSALSRFVARNPKIIGSTISVQAISAAIQSHEVTEKEKIEIVDEIGKKNPQLREDLLQNIFHSDTNVVSNIISYLFIIFIVYLIIKKR